MRRELLLCCSLFLTISNGFIFEALKKSAELFALQSGMNSTKFGNFKGVPNVTLCSEDWEQPELIWYNYTITPDYIAPDEEIHWTASCGLLTDLTGGNVHTMIDFGPYNIYDENQELCAMLNSINLECPVDAGDKYMDTIYIMPQLPLEPNVTFTLRMNITDQNQNLVTCIQVKTKLI